MKILIISDAWHPQINGVLRTLEATTQELILQGHEVRVLGPDPHRWCTFSAPSYAEIKLEFFASSRIAAFLDKFRPDFIHIATEGPLGFSARSVCLRQGRPFTTSYHTRFPEYLAARCPRFLAPLVACIIYALLRRFHAPSSAVMVATASIERELRNHKFYRLVRWSRGVDNQLFKPRKDQITSYKNFSHPILLYVGRIAIEKNLRAFLDIKTSGSLVLIGQGPDIDHLKADYPHAYFLGSMSGEQLAQHYAAADLFVFPSTTDTFGLVLLEACASGLRIAAYPAPGPVDLFSAPETKTFSALDQDIQKAVEQALDLPNNPEAPHNFASHFSWQACATQFFTHLQVPTPKAKRRLLRWRKKIGEGL